MTALLKMIYGAQVAPFTGSEFASLRRHRRDGREQVRGGCQECRLAVFGWLCSAAETVVQPTFGSLNSTSLIRAL